MKKLIIIPTILASLLSYSQVGINTTSPKATLDVVGNPTSPAIFDGVIPPRLTGSQLKAKTYTPAQTGAIVYATAPDPSPSGQTINVATTGLYSFDGTTWLKVNTTAPLPSAQLVLVVKGTGSQADIISPAGAKLAQFSLDSTQTGNTQVLNDPGSWNPATQMYTAPKDGTYQIALTGYVAGCGTATPGSGAYMRTGIKTGANTFTIVNTADLTFTNGKLNNNQLTTINLKAGDQVFADYAIIGYSGYCTTNLPNISTLSIYRFQ